MTAPDLAVEGSPRAWPSLGLTPDEARQRASRLFAADAVLPMGLDLARGLAAVLVLLFHLRTWLLVPYPQLQEHGPAAALFYLATTFGHDAVIVFFVLSGFLIGGAVLRIDLMRPRAVLPYAAARIARIAPVLIGAVALSVAASALARSWPGAMACRDGAFGVIGNLLALGNLGIAPLCNNMPLWSLSNEVAYYVALPVLVAVFRGSRAVGTAAACAVVLLIAVASLYLTPLDQQNVVLYFPVWLAGTALWWLPQRRIPLWLGALAFTAALAFGRLESAKSVFLLRDLLTAASFALLIAGLFHRQWPKAAGLRRLASILSLLASATAAISFSLYVVHNPIIGLYESWAQSRGQSLPFDRLTGATWGVLLGLFVATVAVAMLFSLVFERHHHRLALWLKASLARRSASK